MYLLYMGDYSDNSDLVKGDACAVITIMPLHKGLDQIAVHYSNVKTLIISRYKLDSNIW